ncbi:hypothetical protein [Candidatus Rhodobacter oscarellae]|uniref:hypothetical protein n=1 Tax=Candidatus Rhodobacter oscarellae TaxID=1675527 RepID=UPI0006717568|nr:hypothetical protein [Candidatus Rhodobacter lobularis]
MKFFIYVTLLFASASISYAGQVLDVSSVGTGMQKTQAHVIGEGHVILQALTEYQAFESADPNSPLSSLSGDCFGAIEIVVNQATGGGNCIFGDGDGNATATSWSVTGFGANGSLMGTWSYVGGTGTFTGITGGGTFDSVTDQATGMFSNQISGAAYLP